jgi:hypothetical protein
MPGALRIGTVRAHCEATGESMPAAQVHERARRALGGPLRDAIRGALARRVDGADESVWIVRRLELPVVVRADVEPDILAAALAHTLARALDVTLVGDGDGANAIRFESPAAHLSRFVYDVATYESWDRWYLAPFAGLRALPRSVAIRTALTEDPPLGLGALQRLDDDALACVCAALLEADVWRVLTALREAQGHSAESSVTTRSSQGAERERQRDGAAGGFRTLHAFVRASATRRSAGSIDSPQEASESPPARGPGSPASIIPGMIATDTTTARRSTESRASSGSQARRDFARARPIESDPRAAIGATSRTAPSSTRFGGLLLLLADLDALPWEEWSSGWPSPPEGDASAISKWLTLVICAGRQEVRSAIDDGTLRALMGVARELRIEDIGFWLRRSGPRRQLALREEILAASPSIARTELRDRWFGLPPRSKIGAHWSATFSLAARAVMRRFANRLPGLADSTPVHLWRNVLAFDATVEFEGERIVVRSGRPPLHLLLVITGMVRGSAVGRGAGGRPIHLYPAE